MLSRTVPVISAPLNAVRPGGRASLLRLPIGLLLIAGGVFSFLPGLGIWMLPLGLMLVAEDVLAERRKAWRPRETAYGSGALWRYARTVGPASKGALTHPGAKAERHVYADI